MRITTVTTVRFILDEQAQLPLALDYLGTPSFTMILSSGKMHVEYAVAVKDLDVFGCKLNAFNTSIVGLGEQARTTLPQTPKGWGVIDTSVEAPYKHETGVPTPTEGQSGYCSYEETPVLVDFKLEEPAPSTTAHDRQTKMSAFISAAAKAVIN